jgi:hypothetical protein
MAIDKEYKFDIKRFKELEKALIKWFTIFKWNVSISGKPISLISLARFSYSVKCNFYCDGCELTTLKWCPRSVGGSFWCYNNKLTSLEWCPNSVGWDIRCYDNNLIPLEKKKHNVFKIGDDIYIWNVNINHNDIQKLMNLNLFTYESSKEYYDAFINFKKSTTKLDNKDITDTDIVFNGKRLKKKFLNL